MNAYRGWSFIRGFNCKVLTGKTLVFWIGGHLWEVVAHRGLTVIQINEKPVYLSLTVFVSLIL